MRPKSIGFMGLFLILGLGLVWANMGLCQATKTGETQQPAISPGGQAPAPAAKEGETGQEAQPANPESKAAPATKAPAPAPATPEKTATPKKLPGRFSPSEGC